MLFANYTSLLDERFGVETAVEMIADAGFPAVDISMLKPPAPPFSSDWRDLARRLNKIAEKRGITYIQGHAPCGKWQTRKAGRILPSPAMWAVVSAC